MLIVTTEPEGAPAPCAHSSPHLCWGQKQESDLQGLCTVTPAG